MFNLFYITDNDNIGSLNFNNYRNFVLKENLDKSAIEILIDDIKVFSIQKSYIIKNLDNILSDEASLLKWYDFIISNKVFSKVKELKSMGFLILTLL